MNLPATVTPAHFVTCEYCGLEKAVRSPSQAKRQRFCSRRCAATVTGGVATIPKAERSARAKAAGLKHRQRRMAELGQWTRIEVYRRAYRCGWKAGIRYMQKYAS